MLKYATSSLLPNQTPFCWLECAIVISKIILFSDLEMTMYPVVSTIKPRINKKFIHFFSYLTARATSSLKKQLENAENSHSIAVSSFYHSLMILNMYIPWLPSNVQHLTNLVLSFAFNQSMQKPRKLLSLLEIRTDT